MGTRIEVEQAISEAFDSDLSDCVVTLTFNNYDKNQNYDVATGESTRALLSTCTTRGIFTGSWKYEVFNSAIDPLDETILVLQNEITLIPEIGTEVISPKGITRVIEKREDPLNVSWELRVRF